MSYADNVELAQRLINAKGRDISLEVLSSTPEDINKPWKPGAAGIPTVATSYSVKAVFVPAAGADLGKTFVDKELLKRCDEVMLVAGQTNDLTTCHRVLDGGKYWRIAWTKVLEPGDTKIFYAMGVVR